MSLNIVKYGNIIAKADLNVSGNTSINGTSTLTGSVTASSTLNVSSTSTLSGAVTTGSTLNVSGNTIIGGSLTVSGSTILSGWNVKDIIAGSNITVQNNSGNYTISSTASGGGGGGGTSSTTLGFDTPTFSLSLLGSAINGTQTNEFFGQEVSISSDGTVIAVGLSNAGTAKIYAWNGTSWIQRGTTFS
jgi:hypothetical protein